MMVVIKRHVTLHHDCVQDVWVQADSITDGINKVRSTPEELMNEKHFVQYPEGGYTDPKVVASEIRLSECYEIQEVEDESTNN